jgi:hypothetical protein
LLRQANQAPAGRQTTCIAGRLTGRLFRVPFHLTADGLVELVARGSAGPLARVP